MSISPEAPSRQGCLSPPRIPPPQPLVHCQAHSKCLRHDGGMNEGMNCRQQECLLSQVPALRSSPGSQREMRHDLKSQIPEVEMQASSGHPWLSRLEPCFCLFQHRGVAVWWYREGCCRFLLVSMSLPVPSAEAHLASRAPEGTDLALPMLWTDG